MSAPDPQFAVACHEASHWCIGRLLGLEMGGLEIRPDGSGCVSLLDKLATCEVSTAILMYQAGYIAETRVDCSRVVSWSDQWEDEEVVHALAICFDHKSERKIVLAHLQARAIQLVDENWESIQMLARRLVERKTLTRAEAEETPGLSR